MHTVYVSFQIGKILILMVKRNLQSVHYYPEGASPLCARVIPILGTGCLEALASGTFCACKNVVVYREVCSEDYLRLIKEQIPRQKSVLTACPVPTVGKQVLQD